MKTVLCFGDSNTWGYSPLNAARYPREVRWPGRLQNELGHEYHVIEEGLNGRTTVFDDPLGDHWNGREYFIPCIDTHRPMDLIVIMLGTNDIKTRFCLTAFDIAYAVGLLVDICNKSIAGPNEGPPKVLLVCPPPVIEVGPWAEMFHGAQDKCTLMPERYAAVAQEHDCEFFDAGTVVTPSQIDGVHWDAPEHAKMAGAMADQIRRIIG